MGRDKADLPWRNSTLLRHIAGQVRNATGSVTLVGGKAIQEFRHVPDLWPGFGPVGAIATALRDSGTSTILAVACDMPQVHFSFLTSLLEIAGEQCAVPVTPDGRMHPLCAVYSQTDLPVFERAIEAGEHKLQNVVGRLNYTVVPVTDMGLVSNVNTPAEYAEALAATSGDRE